MIFVNELIRRYPTLLQCKKNITEAIKILEKCICNGNKIFVCGNGGSASDADHIVGELMKSFILPRPIDKNIKIELEKMEGGKELAKNLQGTIPCINLTQHNALSTAFNNDVNPQLSFAQQLYGYGEKNDVLIGISTSGNSENVVYAAKVAKAKKIHVIGLTGKRDSKLTKISDITIQVPEEETYKIQELHLPIYHCICLELEKKFWGN